MFLDSERKQMQKAENSDMENIQNPQQVYSEKKNTKKGKNKIQNLNEPKVI